VEQLCCPEATERVAVELPLEPESAGRARATLGPLGPHLDVSSFDAVLLIVSELVADSLAAGSAPASGTISVRAEPLETGARIVFRLDGVPLRVRGRKPQLGEPGWGVYLVQSLAARWSARHEGASTSIWFEL
jgi:hypothetical protein